MRAGFTVFGHFGRYYIRAEINRGGFGVVLRGEDEYGAEVAIKRRHDVGEESARQFARELKILQTLQHPNIIEILDHGTDGQGGIWYAMPVMPRSVDDLVGERLHVEFVLQLIAGAARGLATYHAWGGIHRDIKGANILLDNDWTPKLADFGLARCPALTGSGMTRSAYGTPEYMAPEAFAGNTCCASDVFSLGLVLWELAQGRHRRLPSDTPSNLGLTKDFADIDWLYRVMTHANPAQRPTALAVAACCDEIIRRRRAPPPAPPPKNESVWPWVIGGAVVAIVGAAIVAAVADQR